MTSTEKDLKRLRKSLHETQDILNDLVKDASADMEKKWGSTTGDAGKRLREAGKRFEKRYDETRGNLEAALLSVSKDLEKNYPKQKKDVERAINKFSDSAKYNYKDLSAEARKRLGDLRSTASVRTNDLKLRAADLLQGLAVGVLSLRNRLEPKKRLALRNEKEKHHLGKGGYFKRFVALAIIIVSKKDQLLNLGQQLYSKLQDTESRQALKDDALSQYDTLRRLIKASASGQYKEFPYTSLIKIVAAVVYFVSVVDLIPDFIPVLGLTDDLAVLAWVYSSVKDDLQQFLDWEEANERRREKMDSQKSTINKPATPASDREASPNAASTASKTTSTPSTTPIGTSSGSGSGINTAGSPTSGSKPNTSGSGTSGSNTGSSGGNASATSGSSNPGNTTSASSGGSSNSGSDKSSGGGSSNQRTGGSSNSGNSGHNPNRS